MDSQGKVWVAIEKFHLAVICQVIVAQHLRIIEDLFTKLKRDVLGFQCKIVLRLVSPSGSYSHFNAVLLNGAIRVDETGILLSVVVNYYFHEKDMIAHPLEQVLACFEN